MNVYQFCISNQWRCVEKQSSWRCFTLRSSTTTFKTRAFPVPAPILFSLIASITCSDCFYPPLLCCCCWNERPDRKGFWLLSSFRRISFELFFDFTDSVKWLLTSFPKRFSSLVCINSTLFFSVIFASWRKHMFEINF